MRIGIIISRRHRELEIPTDREQRALNRVEKRQGTCNAEWEQKGRERFMVGGGRDCLTFISANDPQEVSANRASRSFPAAADLGPSSVQSAARGRSDVQKNYPKLSVGGAMTGFPSVLRKLSDSKHSRINVNRPRTAGPTRQNVVDGRAVRSKRPTRIRFRPVPAPGVIRGQGRRLRSAPRPTSPPSTRNRGYKSPTSWRACSHVHWQR